MYQKCILPYFIIPSTFSPQASSPLERYGRTDRGTDFNTPCYLSSFFFPLSARGPTRRFSGVRTHGFDADIAYNIAGIINNRNPDIVVDITLQVGIKLK